MISRHTGKHRGSDLLSYSHNTEVVISRHTGKHRGSDLVIQSQHRGSDLTSYSHNTAVVISRHIVTTQAVSDLSSYSHNTTQGELVISCHTNHSHNTGRYIDLTSYQIAVPTQGDLVILGHTNHNHIDQSLIISHNQSLIASHNQSLITSVIDHITVSH